MAYTGRIDPQEDVGLAVSDDLVHWRKAADRPVWLRNQEAPYDRSEDGPGINPAWHDPFVVRNPRGEWEAFLCALTRSGPLAGRACVARARLESATKWVALPPIADLGQYAMMEVPEVFPFDGRYGLTFNSGCAWGRRLDTPARRVASGTFYLVADEWDGPWRVPEDNLLLGSGDGRRDAVVARSIEYGGGRLVYHHYTGSIDAQSPRAMGLPKVLAAAAEDCNSIHAHVWNCSHSRQWSGAPDEGPFAWRSGLRDL